MYFEGKYQPIPLKGGFLQVFEELERVEVFNTIENVSLEEASHRLIDGFSNSANAVRSEVDGRRFIIRDDAGDDRVLIGYQKDGF